MHSCMLCEAPQTAFNASSVLKPVITDKQYNLKIEQKTGNKHYLCLMVDSDQWMDISCHKNTFIS